MIEERLYKLRQDIVMATGISSQYLCESRDTATSAVREPYGECVGEIQTNIENRVKLIIFNYILGIGKYCRWDKYPRKVKKMMKKKDWWKYKDFNFTNVGLSSTGVNFNNDKRL